MTMPYGSAEEPEIELIGMESIPVRVVSTDAKPGKQIAPEFGRFRTFIVANVIGQDLAVPGAVRIANRSLRRKRLHIIVNASVANQPFIDGVIIGGREEIAAANSTNVLVFNPGGYLQIGDSMRWECQQELWACYPSSNTNPVIVTVCDERYASDPDSYKEHGG